MKLCHILAILISLSAVFGYLNYRYLKLPTAIGLMLIATLATVVAGLLIGNRRRSFARSDKPRGHLDAFGRVRTQRGCACPDEPAKSSVQQTRYAV